MNKKGFVLLELLIVLAIVAVLAGGGWYLTQLQNEQSAVTTGVNTEQQAQQVVQQSNQQTQQEQNILNQTTSNPKSTTTTPIIPPSPPKTGTTTDVSNPNSETINGVAYLSPNQGEGLSVQYNEPVEEPDPNNPGRQITVIYHPFQDLQYHIDASTKITNSENQAIPFSDIKVGDNLLVHMSAGPCVMGTPGGSSGCNIEIFSIQDLSL
jgi:prepilin-type N-terminal cleavage/methylation domain-containing protein